MATAKLQVTGAIDIDPIRRERLYVNVVGGTPLILNRLSEKVMHERGHDCNGAARHGLSTDAAGAGRIVV